MRLSVCAVRAMFATLVLLSPATAIGKSRANQILPTLRAGQWIQLEGIVQKDSQVQCNALRLLAGDFLDDDWSLMGRVESVDASSRRLRIGSIPIQVISNAVIDGPGGMLGLSDIRTGMFIEVDGTYLKNGTFRAKEIEDESREVRRNSERGQPVAIVGKIERIDAARRRITVMGTDFLISEKTQLKSVVR